MKRRAALPARCMSTASTTAARALAAPVAPCLSSDLRVSSQLCVQNSPQEARNMLLQNPQLAYALLQAQVVMRIVDPEIALVCPFLPHPGSVGYRWQPVMENRWKRTPFSLFCP